MPLLETSLRNISPTAIHVADKELEKSIVVSGNIHLKVDRLSFHVSSHDFPSIVELAATTVVLGPIAGVAADATAKAEASSDRGVGSPSIP